MRAFILVFLLLLDVHADQQGPRRPTKINRPYTLYTPVGIGTFANETDLIPGNNSFGIFFQKLSESKNICRIRLNAFCDYGLGIKKEIKQKTVIFQFQKEEIHANTDGSGFLDFFFYCDTSIEKKKITIKYQKYNKEYDFSSFPQELSIPEKSCGN